MITFLPTSQQAIGWLHHLLELCHYFIPDQSPNDAIFNWIFKFLILLHAAQLHQLENMAIVQKIWILHFLQLTGSITHELSRQQYVLINEIADLLEKNTITAFTTPPSLLHYTKKDHRNLTAFILQKLQGHPCFKHFKTIPFVYSS